VKLHQIRYFLAICEEKSFTGAARRCGVKQPSITRAIKLLEDEVGGPLFVRSSKGIALSPFGAALHADFVRIEKNAVALQAKSETVSRFAAHDSQQSG